MSPLTISCICTLCIFGGAISGMCLRLVLPKSHLLDDSKETVKVGAAIIASLAALVLGLLVSSATETFNTMSNEVTESAAKIILLDRLLANYGPETKSARTQLQSSIKTTIENVWSPQATKEIVLTPLQQFGYMEPVQKELLNLAPGNDSQKFLMEQSQQIVVDLRQTGWFLVEQSHNSLPTAFLFILVFWLTALHISYGLFAPRNWTVISVMFISALSFSCAIFLILELGHPLSGLVKVSGAPMQNALDYLGQN